MARNVDADDAAVVEMTLRVQEAWSEGFAAGIRAGIVAERATEPPGPFQRKALGWGPGVLKGPGGLLEFLDRAL